MMRIATFVCMVILMPGSASVSFCQDFTFKPNGKRLDNYIVVWHNGQSTVMSLRPDEDVFGKQPLPRQSGPFLADVSEAMKMTNAATFEDILASPVRCVELINLLQKSTPSKRTAVDRKLLLMGTFAKRTGIAQWRAAGSPEIITSSGSIEILFPMDTYSYRGPEGSDDPTLLVASIVTIPEPGTYSVKLSIKPPDDWPAVEAKRIGRQAITGSLTVENAK